MSDAQRPSEDEILTGFLAAAYSLVKRGGGYNHVMVIWNSRAENKNDVGVLVMHPGDALENAGLLTIAQHMVQEDMLKHSEETSELLGVSHEGPVQ